MEFPFYWYFLQQIDVQILVCSSLTLTQLAFSILSTYYSIQTFGVPVVQKVGTFKITENCVFNLQSEMFYFCFREGNYIFRRPRRKKYILYSRERSSCYIHLGIRRVFCIPLGDCKNILHPQEWKMCLTHRGLKVQWLFLCIDSTYLLFLNAKSTNIISLIEILDQVLQNLR